MERMKKTDLNDLLIKRPCHKQSMSVLAQTNLEKKQPKTNMNSMT